MSSTFIWPFNASDIAGDYSTFTTGGIIRKTTGHIDPQTVYTHIYTHSRTAGKIMWNYCNRRWFSVSVGYILNKPLDMTSAWQILWQISWHICSIYNLNFYHGSIQTFSVCWPIMQLLVADMQWKSTFSLNCIKNNFNAANVLITGSFTFIPIHCFLV